MPSDVAACAHKPLGLQRDVKGRVRAHRLLLSGLRGLLGQGSVAVEAGARRLWIVREHASQLAGYAWTRASRVQRGLPVRILGWVAGPAARRRQGPFDGRK